MVNSLSFKPTPAPLRTMFRPMLLMALGLHALLLFAPLPAEQKPKEPDDKKNPIKVTQLPTAKPPAIKPSKPAKATATPKKASAPNAPTASPFASVTAPLAPPAPPAALAPLQTVQPTTPATTAPTIPAKSGAVATSSATFTGDPAKAFQDLLVNLRGTKKSESGKGEPDAAPLNEIIQPELLFKGADGQGGVSSSEKLPGLEKSLLVEFPVEDNLNLDSFYQKELEPKLKAIFESISKVGDYGEGPLYKLTRGSYTTYLSLMPPKQAVGAIVSVWSKDPRPNSSAP